jgi:ATP-binding cassette subfamily B protein
VPIPLAILKYVTYGTSEETKSQMARYYEEIAKLNGGAVEFVNGMQVVKIFNRAGAAIGRFASDIMSHIEMAREGMGMFGVSYSLFTTLIGSSISFVIPVGVVIGLFQDDLVSFIPKVLFFVIIGGIMNLPLNKLRYIGHLMGENLEGMKRIDEILYSEELAVPENPQIPQDWSLEFDDVSFSYAEEEVLHGISFRIEAGQLCGLVGPSGGGKTTIAQLAARFWDIQHGQIRIGGIDTRDMEVRCLMDSIAFVFQDAYMFRDTVENNIRMGNATASREQVEQAARAAQAEEFIARLENGYDTVLGEGSVHLSGGEKQRIAIARAILKNAPVIILDEATAHADAENEAKIQAAFGELTRGKTVLVIAHRLSSIREAECILVVDEGRILERGTHEQLIDIGGIYRNMVDLYNRAQDWEMDVGSD